MTADEIASIVYLEQGFLVMASYKDLSIGTVHRAECYGDAEPQIPLRCIGKATHGEFVSQVNRLNELRGESFSSEHVPGTRYFRVEPAD